ncbi:TetR/AcrR family transcriptional regulator [Nocardioides fonticola]|uniref:TetR/AcrR family transcriptional regulator n=1 Tax=Nocardioides fonticola TaxID=450363 RepID=A0ABP7Y1Y2_9ACTN
MPVSSGPTRRGAARRAELLDGLIEVMLREGFAGLSLDDLAARLQCSKSTLYAVAASKEQLIAAAVREFFRRATERVEARAAAEPDATERIRAYLDAIAAELAPATPTFLADVDAFAPTREIYDRNTSAAAARVADLVAAAARPGRPVDAAFVGAVAAAVMPAIQHGRLGWGAPHDHAAAYSALADLILAGLVGAPRR